MKNKPPTPRTRSARATTYSSKALHEERTLRVRALDKELKRLFPHARIALVYSSPWELLVAVILSAQCTDVMVNKVTAQLFAKYRTLNDYATADPAQFERDIRSTGFFRTKARHIIAAAKRLEQDFGGMVPQTMDELISLPGVARKTANVVLGNAFGVVEGIAVDTHVKRFAIRFDLTSSSDPVVIERDLMDILPRRDWMGFTYRVIEYGRTIAPARVYDTGLDPLVTLYPKAGSVFRVNG